MSTCVKRNPLDIRYGFNTGARELSGSNYARELRLNYGSVKNKNPFLASRDTVSLDSGARSSCIFYKEWLNVDELKSKAVAQVLKTRMKTFRGTRLT